MRKARKGRKRAPTHVRLTRGVVDFTGHRLRIQVWLRDAHQPTRDVQARPGEHEVHPERGPRTLQLRTGTHTVPSFM
jgi:hypothetical protein